MHFMVTKLVDLTNKSATEGTCVLNHTTGKVCVCLIIVLSTTATVTIQGLTRETNNNKPREKNK